MNLYQIAFLIIIISNEMLYCIKISIQEHTN